MADGIRFDVKELNELVKLLGNSDALTERYFKGAVTAYAMDTVRYAKQGAPVNFGNMARNISAIKEDESGLQYEFVVQAYYAPYVEFGTGGKVSVPDELREIATEVKNRPSEGSFAEGLASIELWCKRKNIDVKFAYPIFISILNKGIEPQPFVYPALTLSRRQFIAQLKLIASKIKLR